MRGSLPRAAGQRRQEMGALLRRVRRSRLVGQAALYAGASALTSVFAGVAQILLARALSPGPFGSLAFATSFLLFVSIFFEFGVFLPAARQIARAPVAERRELVGAALAVFVPIGLSFSLLCFGASFVVDDLFHVHVGSALRVASFLAFAYPFVSAGLNLSQGSDRLHVSSISSAVGQAAFLAVLAGLVAAGITMTTTSALVLRSAGYVITMALIVVWLRPVFRRVPAHARRLIADARAWGFHVYTGRVLSIGTYNMDVLMLGVFADVKSIGYYSLAGSLANFLGWPVSGLATALFPRMTREARIDRRWLLAAWGVGLAAAIGVAALAHPAVALVFGSGYSRVAALAVPLMMAQAVRGVTSVYNSFLAAQARGRELRKAGLVLTGSNLALNFALIPPFGAMGAAWASLLALVANYAAHVLYYRRALGAGEIDAG